MPVTPEIPLHVTEQIGPNLDRALLHLPDAALELMRQGLDRHDDRLVVGRLYSRHRACAVGAMLREIYPALDQRTLTGRLRRRPRRSVLDQHPQLARSLPRLAHIEMFFDATVRRCAELDERPSQAQWAQAAGRWLAGRITAEIERRARRSELQDLHLHVPSHWLAGTRTRERERTRELATA